MEALNPDNNLLQVVSNLGAVGSLPMVLHHSHIVNAKYEDVLFSFRFATLYSDATPSPCLRYIIANSPLKLFR